MKHLINLLRMPSSQLKITFNKQNNHHKLQKRMMIINIVCQFIVSEIQHQKGLAEELIELFLWGV